MATKAAIVAGLLPTSGTRDYTATGFGTVDAAIVIVSQANSTNNPTSSLEYSIGFWDGVNSVQHAYQSRAAHGVTTSETRRLQKTNIILNTNDNSLEATASAITNGLRLTVTGSTGVERYITLIFIGGVTDVHLDQLELGTGTSAIDVTAPGFKPGLVFFLSNGNSSANNGNYDTIALSSFGVAHNNSSDTIVQGAILGRSDDFVSTANTFCYASHSIVAGQISASGTPTWTAAISDFDASGFSITPSASTSSDVLSYLAIQLADPDDAWVDVIDAATSTGNSSQSGFGFSPDAVGLVGSLSTSLGTAASGRMICFGAGDASGEQCLTCCDEDAVTITDSSSLADTSNILNLRDQNDGVDAVASLGSLDSDGFTLNYSDAASAAFKILAFAIGDSTAGGGPSVNINGSTVSWNGLTSYNWNGIA